MNHYPLIIGRSGQRQASCLLTRATVSGARGVWRWWYYPVDAHGRLARRPGVPDLKHINIRAGHFSHVTLTTRGFDCDFEPLVDYGKDSTVASGSGPLSC